MFKSSNPLVRFVFNFLFALGLFWLFKEIGWIQISSEYSIWLVALVVVLLSVIVGFLLGLLMIVLSPVIIIVTILTLGLGLIVLGPAAQYFSLLLISKVTLMYTITTVWWQALLIGLAFGWLRFTPPSSSGSSD